MEGCHSPRIAKLTPQLLSETPPRVLSGSSVLAVRSAVGEAGRKISSP